MSQLSYTSSQLDERTTAVGSFRGSGPRYISFQLTSNLQSQVNAPEPTSMGQLPYSSSQLEAWTIVSTRSRTKMEQFLADLENLQPHDSTYTAIGELP